MLYERKHRYVHSLDGLRALAVLSVIAYHLNLKWAPGGFLGVDVFFVLSGYLITSILLDQQQQQTFSLQKFWISRVRRLLPAAYCMIAATVLWIIFFKRSLLHTIHGDALTSVFYMSNWWFIFHKVSYFDSFNSMSPLKNLWSLAIEEQFYIIWPLFLLVGLKLIKSRKKLTVVIFLFTLLSAGLMGFLYEPGEDPSRIYYGTDTRAFALLLGGCLAFIWPMQRLSSKNLPKPGRRILNVVSLITFAILIFCMATVDEFKPFVYKGGMFLIALNTAILIATISHPSSFLGKVLSVKPLTWIGTRSYGIYLWHYPIIILTTPLSEMGIFNPVRMGLQVGVTLLIAELSYRYFEAPIRQNGFLYYFKMYHPKRLIQWKLLPHKQRIITILPVVVCVVLISDFAYSFTYKASTIEASPKQTVIKVHHTAPAHTEVKPNPDPNKDKPVVKPAEPPKPAYTDVLAIGDSIMLDIAPELQKLYGSITIDGKVGRQMSEAIELAPNYQSFNHPDKAIIVELGTNGYFTGEQLDAFLSHFPEAQIFIVNTKVPRPWEDDVNVVINQKARQSKKIQLIDWYSHGSNHPEYFAPDGVHLQPSGARKLASLISQEMNS
ncbi:acyltransferase family protein [Priestia koreensis]|uniref:acyltransferase family protein n=1 Tax=Priestia koreensis TaxID=284581 RepID=UPI001F57B7FA|nr:acyltransferase family protein [Priestia koreensis]UNL85252.1 acetyltransferase [Priestia koreensis]